MALLFMDGFDHVDDAYQISKWEGSNTQISYISGYGRNGGWGIDLFGYAAIISKNIPNTSTIIIGGAFLIDAVGLTSFFRIHTNGELAISFTFDSGNILKLYIDGTLIASASAGEFLPNVWGYIEVKALFSTTVGTVEVRVDGVTVINETGIDTTVGGLEYCNSVNFRGNAATQRIRVDDLYICDGTGTKNNDFLGDVTISPLYPTSDGTYNDFSLQGGSDHYAMVDDPQLNDESTYIESSTVGHKDSYGMTTFPGSDVIHGVQISVNTKNIDAGTMNIRTLCRSGATPTDAEGSNHAISQTPKAVITIHEKEPVDVVDWTATTINNAEFGVKIQS